MKCKVFLILIFMLIGGIAYIYALPDPIFPVPMSSVTPQQAGLIWQECELPIPAQAFTGSARDESVTCFGHPAPLLVDQNGSGSVQFIDKTHIRMTVNQEVYEARANDLIALTVYTLSKNYNPVKSLVGFGDTLWLRMFLSKVNGHIAWGIENENPATIIYDGKDLRNVYGLVKAHAAYGLAGKLIFVGEKDGKFFIVYDGQKVGPAYERITIGYCCETVLYTARGSQGRYQFRGTRGGRDYIVEISASPMVPPLPFSKEQAVARATQDARLSVPEVGIRQARIENITAELITLAEADSRMGGQRGPGGYGSGQTPTSPVWWVVVRGYFQYEGMGAPPNAAPICEADERDFAYDARTGESVGGSIPNTHCAQSGTPRETPTFADVEWVSSARTVDQLMSEADLVVRARVSEAPVTRVLRNELPVMDANGKITGYMTDEMLFSDTVFDILEVFSGKAPPKITVMQTGGTRPDIPRNSIEVRDDPLYHLGEEYVLFLVDISGDPVQAPGRVLYRTVNPFGRYRIESERVLSYGENTNSLGLPPTLAELVAQIKRER